jgi:HEAT repeat protein
MNWLNVIVIVITQTLSSPLAAQDTGATQSAIEARVREILSMVEPKEHAEELVRLGEQAFPSYEKVLTDPKSHHSEVTRVFSVLRFVQADRRRFVEHAVRRLSDSHVGVRRSAVQLLGQIGGRGDASPIVALLWDEDRTAVYAAVEALSAIGGAREGSALDIWLRSGSRRDDAALRNHVQHTRDALRRKVEKERER